jgi:NADH-quinone oxidoreductase subunit L
MTMAAFVTGVSALIHLYSVGYMEHDRDFTKFFLYLNLFVFSMLMLVLSDNLLVTFFGWEGVGVCSYFLISFWFGRPTAASAGKKAMIYNRIGDAGFLVGIFLIYERTGTLQYNEVFARIGHLSSSNLVAISLLLFLGAVGKSAQIPLFPWLADAMEGPTPVSALIHAATMVTAGVYLMCRISPILHLAPDAAHTIAWVGAITAFIGATSGCAQTDIKKVLAYSTVSQLGYMFLAAGCGAYDAAIFLMLTHAFYKALLFLSAGSVIHGMGDEQDIKKMGALAKAMPLTSVAFLIGWLSIAGIPPLSGFWAKSDVLLNAWTVSPALWVVGAVTAVITAYYMGREYLLVFTGAARWPILGDGHAAHPHDPRKVMTVPLIVLSIASIFAGLLNLPFHPHLVFLERWLAPVVGSSLLATHSSLAHTWVLAVTDAVLAGAGVLAAVTLWRGVVDRPVLEPRFLFRAWRIDDVIDQYVAQPSTALASVTDSVVETKVIDGAVNGVATAVRRSGDLVRKTQTGYVRNYALGIVFGTVVLFAYFLVRVHG